MNTYQTYQKGPRAGQCKTLTDRVVKFLVEGLHKRELPSKNKYRKFPGSREDSFYWVGKAGAVRAGRNISNSVSLTGQVHANMRLWEKQTKQ